MLGPSPPSTLLEPCHQIGFIVEDLEHTMDELSKGLGVTWLPPNERTFGEWNVRTAFSHGGRFELVEGAVGAPWDTSGGTRLDHLAHFAHDLEAAQRHLESIGWPMVVDGAEYGGRWCYHQPPWMSQRIELVDFAFKAAYDQATGAVSGDG